MSSQSSSNHDELTTAKVLNWTRGLETFERLDFVYLLVHSLFPTELRYLHGIIDGLLKRDEAVFASSVHQANDFARLSSFYERHDPHSVIANDGLRCQFIVDLSTLHPQNYYCADIFYNVLAGAEVNTWQFDLSNTKILRELILITNMVARHPAFRFDCRLCVWNNTRMLTKKLNELKEQEEEDTRRARENADSPNIETVGLEPRNLEEESTLTTSRGERIMNGFIQPIVSPAVPYFSVLQTGSTQPVVSGFPPLTAPVGATLTSSSTPARPVTVDNPRVQEGKTRSDQKQKQAEKPLPRRASSMENYDRPPGSSSKKDNPADKPDSSHKGRKKFVAQNSDPSAGNSIRPSFTSQENTVASNQQSQVKLATGHDRVEAEHKVIEIQNNKLPVGSSQPVVTANTGNITGSFPHTYKYLPNGALTAPTAYGPHPRFQNQVNQRNAGCYNCGLRDHVGINCPKKKPLSVQEADNYCTLKRDSKQYPQKGRPLERPPGPS